MPAALSLYAGDDWVIPITLQSASGTPLNLVGSTVGANVWITDYLNPSLSLSEGSGIVVDSDRTSGKFRVRIGREVTSGIDAQARYDAHAPIQPVRIQVYADDSAGNRRTYVVVLITPLCVRAQ